MKTDQIALIRVLKNFLPLKDYFIKNRWALAVGLFSLLLVDFFQLLIPLVIKRAVDSLTMKTATSFALLKFGIIIISIALTIGLFRYIWRYFLLGHSRIVEEKLRNRLYGHLQTLSFSFYQRTKTGDLMARAVNDLNAIRMATGMGLVALTDGLVLGTAAIGFMVYIDVHLTLICLIPGPIIIYLSMILTRRMSAGYERIQSTFSDMTERVREAFTGIRIVKAYSRESWEYQRIEKEGKIYISENMKLARTIALFFPIMMIFTNLGLAFVIWFGGRLTIIGDITTGDFVAFIGYLNLLTWPMMAMGWVTNLIQRGSVSMRRINEILMEVPEITGPTLSDHIPSISGDIMFKGLDYRYPGQVDNALSNINLRIEDGKTIALVGKVGCGKTTLLHIIPRLLNTPEGSVYINETDIHNIPLKVLREKIGFATQEAILFSDTIRNNVLFGKKSVTEERVIDILKTTQIYDEILGFENGVDTLLGEKGISLSGGQRQRLTIARALFTDPHILILDDVLSMVDTGTEERILNRILKLRKNKTNLIVSHRLSTISRADIIVVLDKGKVVEKGDHMTLLDKGGAYAKIYKKSVLSRELEM